MNEGDSMFKRTIQLLTLSCSALAISALADSSQPVCRGTAVDSSVRGQYLLENGMPVKISADRAVYPEGREAQAWTCEKSGVLVLVLQYDDNPNDENFESHAIAMSGHYMLDFGEVENNVINPFGPGPELPLSAEGLAKAMSSGRVTILPKQ
jgi:hypothetical protein